MLSNKEKIFENHIVAFLNDKHAYRALSAVECTNMDFHCITSHLPGFIQEKQLVKYEKLQENY